MTDMMIHAQPEIAAEGLVLRPLRRSDAGPILLHAGDRRVARMTTSIPHPFPPGLARRIVERAGEPGRTEDVWAIDATPRGGPDLVGLVMLQRMDRRQSEISYWVAPAFWQGGIASAAVAALIAANPHAADTVFAAVFQDNPASARVLTNCGFQYLGDAEAYSVARGATVPTWTYLRRMGDVGQHGQRA